MLVLHMSAGDVVTIDAWMVIVCEFTGDRVRLALNATGANSVRLLPEDIVIAPCISVWRGIQEQIHIDEDVQIWVLKLELNSVRLGIHAEQHRHVLRTRAVSDDWDDA